VRPKLKGKAAQMSAQGAPSPLALRATKATTVDDEDEDDEDDDE
jgi:hypothetical protein